ncbi:MAG: hypothetical protein V4712_11300 [Pseudomonadota bacterium]
MKLAAPALGAALIALTLTVTPAAAFSVTFSLPSLTFPDSDVTASTKTCDAAQTSVCTPKN